jgi:hypothetical protein
MATYPNQRRFAYEYGQRWPARLPLRDLRTFVSHIHCSEPEDKVLSEVRALCGRSGDMQGRNRRLIPQCERYALCVFREHRALYEKVVRGGY